MTVDIAEITQLIGSLGFPIVMCGYMAIKFDKTLTENTKAIQSLTAIISHLVTDKTSNEDLGVSILKDSDSE